MERRAVVVVNTVADAGVESREFAEFCAGWLRNHCSGEMGCRVVLLYTAGDESAGELAERLAPAFERYGIHTEKAAANCSAECLPERINSLRPEVVFIADSKPGKRVKRSAIGLMVEYRDPRKRELGISAAYGLAALVLYVAIFASFGTIREILSQRSLVSVGVILGTVLAVAYLYGSTVAHVLRYLGIRPKAH
ncbi:MAG: hypothetical protein GXO66_03205 [Euryarchaeota archaeon]|nr:hypothetical protein [Euryarchaeota archaeon]